MEIIDRKPIPIYEAICPECKSTIRYMACEVSFLHISCPVCDMSIWAYSTCPINDVTKGEKAMTDLETDLVIAKAEIEKLKAENAILRQRLDNECDSCACALANERDLRADLIESLQAQLAEYDALAKEYGIDGKTMLALAKSQISTAKANVELQEQLAALRAQLEITGDTSDGYHTFNELYNHRAVLFSVICNDRPALAWKSKLHHDGTMYDGMFIVGIETPDGQATYHYDIEPYWDMFNVQELPQAPEWDGHTPAQAIERISKLSAQPENEPLTRCANCESWDKSISFMSAHACAFWSGNRKNPRYTQEFDFCSFAEAKPERSEG